MKTVLRGGILALLLVLVGCATEVETGGYVPTRAEQQLVLLIEKRLTYAFDVAWFKYPRRLPIQDPEREAAILQSLTARSGSLPVSSARVTQFFTAQMAASREFQSEIIHAWNQGTAQPRSQPVDLAKEIRPRLDAINQEMLQLLANPEVRLSPQLMNYAYGFLRSREYSPNVAHTASLPLKG